ncbi:MAG: chaperone NapD [Burkholderiales bacterium]|uniref:chaperone NapD n=1 Tax=Inhella sp. TaxID=1921806 RepID=UPI001AC226AB|nr:chaperone NapD [Burkholderiales bacterium]
MSILGVVLRVRPEAVAVLAHSLALESGVEVTQNPGDGRLVLVIEDAEACSAAARLGQLALHPDVLASSLVYEYSGEDSPAPAQHQHPHWRQDLHRLDATPSS